jgi:glycosyltransferase involved in cell wall biosynthesis
VVVPILNPPSISNLITSLENQLFDRNQYEVIIVGMDAYQRVHTSDLVLFDHCRRPLSPAEARNRGAALSRGEIIVFTDADCVADNEWLKILAERFADKHVTVVGGGIEFSENNYWTLADNISMFYEYLTSSPPGQRQQLPSLNLAIRHNVFTQVTGFDERYPMASGEDADLTIRLRRSGHILHFEPRAIIRHEPTRNRLIDMLHHAYYQGKYSTKVDPRYAHEEGIPTLIRSRIGLLLLAPIIAAMGSYRVFSSNSHLSRYWHTLPAIYFSKFFWSLGAAFHP